MNTIEDSVCTKELHEKVVELRTAYVPLLGLQKDGGAIVDVFAEIYEAIERVSRRIDGEVVARRSLQLVVGEVVDILSRVSRSADDDRLKELRDLLILTP